MKLKKLLLAGAIVLSSAFAFNKTNAQNLETLTEKYDYNINCIARVGTGSFEYSQTGSNYTIKISAKTENFFDLIFFGKEYAFETTGNILGKDFIPIKYSFVCKDDSLLTEVLQKFDFSKFSANSRRIDIERKNKNKKVIYDTETKINSGTRDMLSALMELRTKQIQKKNKLNIIEEAIPRSFDMIYKGVERIKIGKKHYDAYKFSIEDPDNTIDGGEEAVLYLDTTQKRAPLRLVINGYYLGAISIDISE